MSDDYFMITIGEDGDVYLERFSHESLTKEVELHIEEESLSLKDFASDKEIKNGAAYFLTGNDLPRHVTRLIIKGKIVTPQPVEIIRKVQFNE